MHPNHKDHHPMFLLLALALLYYVLRDPAAL